MLKRGQFRYVEYADDGCNVYQCLWCLGHIVTRDDPTYCYNFCPRCGKSWFNKLECRGHNTPRWFYDRYGENPGYSVMVQLVDGQFSAYDIKHRGYRQMDAGYEWVFEARHYFKGQHARWSSWSEVYRSQNRSLNESKWALGILKRLRADREEDEFGKSEVRVTLKKRL